jgi:hypothetical protein
MRRLTDRAQLIFATLTAGLADPGDARKLDAAPGAYMALCVEKLAPQLFSLAHYGECNGDAMRDPDVVFYVDGAGVYPVSYRNDYAGADNEYVEFDESGQPARVAEAAQADLASFCESWLPAAAEQQNVEV